MIDYPNCGENNPVFEQDEPVAHLWQHGETGRTRIVMPDQIITADASWFVVGPLFLYTNPPQRTFVGLAAEDRLTAKYMQDAPDGIEAVIDYIEAKLKGKNT